MIALDAHASGVTLRCGGVVDQHASECEAEHHVASFGLNISDFKNSCAYQLLSGRAYHTL